MLPWDMKCELYPDRKQGEHTLQGENNISMSGAPWNSSPIKKNRCLHPSPRTYKPYEYDSSHDTPWLEYNTSTVSNSPLRCTSASHHAAHVSMNRLCGMSAAEMAWNAYWAVTIMLPWRKAVMPEPSRSAMQAQLFLVHVRPPFLSRP